LRKKRLETVDFTLLRPAHAGSFVLLRGYTSTWIAFRYSFISGTYLMAVSFGEAPPFLAGLVYLNDDGEGLGDRASSGQLPGKGK
jgi:hypothetical protein